MIGRGLNLALALPRPALACNAKRVKIEKMLVLDTFLRYAYL